ncbi:hypothetical protein [Criibacterium bergeronii]|uniref:Uncharacterized protein n=1 Tax=Criibacterium bergeronii TaxID=1871336 RepID=A0A1C0AE08_9FIRM|nr:hypothetical protein [Criibacterium bergeronii]RDY21413.1 hypothetical protein BBG48_004655 [Criibacterium bergeronii]
MLKTEKVDVWGFEHAIRGMRNPMNSWEKSDSHLSLLPTSLWGDGKNYQYKIGENDLELMRKLFKAGTEHRKYLRQIMVSMDIIAPLYWWKEFDTYKVGTITNSCSTMHKVMSKPFEKSDFSFEKALVDEDYFDELFEVLNDHRVVYLNYDELLKEGKLAKNVTKKEIFDSLIQLLPSSYNQRRTVTMNYENVFSIIKQRTGHKLDEWRELIDILEKLPYIKEIGEQSV